MINKKNVMAVIGWVVLVLVLLGIDQYTKYMAITVLKEKEVIVFLKNILSFSYVENTGAAWGIVSGKIPLFVVITVILVAAILFVVYRLQFAVNEKNRNIIFITKLDLIILVAGALGNLIDRIWHGYVVDFIKTDFIEFPVFNVADCYVTVSIFLLVILILFFMKEEDLDKVFAIKKKTSGE